MYLDGSCGGRRRLVARRSPAIAGTDGSGGGRGVPAPVLHAAVHGAAAASESACSRTDKPDSWCWASSRDTLQPRDPCQGHAAAMPAAATTAAAAFMAPAALPTCLSMACDRSQATAVRPCTAQQFAAAAAAAASWPPVPPRPEAAAGAAAAAGGHAPVAALCGGVSMGAAPLSPTRTGRWQWPSSERDQAALALGAPDSQGIDAGASCCRDKLMSLPNAGVPAAGAAWMGRVADTASQREAECSRLQRRQQAPQQWRQQHLQSPPVEAAAADAAAWHQRPQPPAPAPAARQRQRQLHQQHAPAASPPQAPAGTPCARRASPAMAAAAAAPDPGAPSGQGVQASPTVLQELGSAAADIWKDTLQPAGALLWQLSKVSCGALLALLQLLLHLLKWALQRHGHRSPCCVAAVSAAAVATPSARAVACVAPGRAAGDTAAGVCIHSAAAASMPDAVTSAAPGSGASLSAAKTCKSAAPLTWDQVVQATLGFSTRLHAGAGYGPRAFKGMLQGAPVAVLLLPLPDAAAVRTFEAGVAMLQSLQQQLHELQQLQLCALGHQPYLQRLLGAVQGSVQLRVLTQHPACERAMQQQQQNQHQRQQQQRQHHHWGSWRAANWQAHQLQAVGALVFELVEGAICIEAAAAPPSTAAPAPTAAEPTSLLQSAVCAFSSRQHQHQQQQHLDQEWGRRALLARKLLEAVHVLAMALESPRKGHDQAGGRGSLTAVEGARCDGVVAVKLRGAGALAAACAVVCVKSGASEADGGGVSCCVRVNPALVLEPLWHLQEGGAGVTHQQTRGVCAQPAGNGRGRGSREGSEGCVHAGPSSGSCSTSRAGGQCSSDKGIGGGSEAEGPGQAGALRQLLAPLLLMLLVGPPVRPLGPTDVWQLQQAAHRGAAASLVPLALAPLPGSRGAAVADGLLRAALACLAPGTGGLEGVGVACQQQSTPAVGGSGWERVWAALPP